MSTSPDHLKNRIQIILKKLKDRYASDFELAPALEPLLYLLISKNIAYCDSKIISERKRRIDAFNSMLTSLKSGREKLNTFNEMPALEPFFAEHLEKIDAAIQNAESEIHSQAKFLMQIVRLPVPGDSIGSRIQRSGKKGKPYQRNLLDLRTYESQEKRKIGLLLYLISKHLKENGFEKVSNHIHIYLSEMMPPREMRGIFPSLKSAKSISNYLKKLPFKEVPVENFDIRNVEDRKQILKLKSNPKFHDHVIVDFEISQMNANYELLIS